MVSRNLLVVTGEASGDLHAARLIAELQELAPDLRFFGLGGDEMQRIGFDPVAHSQEIAVVGLTEALRVVPRARRIFQHLLRETDRRRPVGALLVDSPGFNLRLAKELKRRGVSVVYYISPQVWAWRPGRVETLAKRVEKMLVLFPFEVGAYEEVGVPVVHVGHPLVDEVPRLPQIWDRGVGPDEVLRIALLPGSRDVEVETLLPAMLQAVDRLAEQYNVEVRLIRAPTVSPHLFPDPPGLARAHLSVVSQDRFGAIADSHLALCASGTATLEVGLLGTPMLVVYRVGLWSALLGRLLVRVPYISLVNLVMGRAVVPELVQDQVNAETLCQEARRLLEDSHAVSAMRTDLAKLRGRLGASGASRRAALEVARHFAPPA